MGKGGHRGTSPEGKKAEERMWTLESDPDLDPGPDPHLADAEQVTEAPSALPHQKNVIKLGNINRLISPYPIFHGIFTPSLTSTNR